jgi:hypothetical protein
MVAYNGQFSVIIIYDTLPSQNKTHTQPQNSKVTVRSEVSAELIFGLYSLVKKNKIWL